MAKCDGPCIRNYIVSGIEPPIPAGAINSPFVIAELTDGSNRITVGNQSAPGFKNKAAIKSFSYGRSNGCGCVLEIVDEEGGSFERLFSKLVHDPSTASFYTLRIKWGWISSYCDGTFRMSSQSSWHYFPVSKFKIKFESKVKFILESSDPMNPAALTRNTKSYGNIDLKDAIVQLCNDNAIPVRTVRFRKRGPDGRPVDWDFKDQPKGPWESKGESLLDIIRRWSAKYLTDGDKGMVLVWDDTSTEFTLEIWEDFKSQTSNGNLYTTSVGGFIVNGGGCSNVISFDTDINGVVILAYKSGSGGFFDATRGKEYRESQSTSSQNKDVGLTTLTQVDEAAKRAYGDDAGSKVMDALKKNENADSHFLPIFKPISGLLKITGNPTLDQGTAIIGSSVGIAVINPYNIINLNEGCEWQVSGGSAIAQSSCNTVLSHKEWLIRGVSHEISDGSYTTTLDVYLNLPGFADDSQ